jgi:hypothetical protein
MPFGIVHTTCHSYNGANTPVARSPSAAGDLCATLFRGNIYGS